MIEAEIDSIRSVGAATTLDRQNRTVEVTALSGFAPISVRDRKTPDLKFNPPWIEELDPAGAKLEGLANAPVLRNHENKAEAALGIVIESSLQNNQIRAKVQFDKSMLSNDIMNKIDFGSVRACSLGTKGRKYIKLPDRGGMPVYRAVEWTPFELSFVPIGADPGALVRGKAMTTVETGSVTGTETQEITVEAPIVANRAAINAQIRSVAEMAGLERSWADKLIDTGADDIHAIRSAAFELMTSKRSATKSLASVQVIEEHSDPVSVRSAMSDALAGRLDPAIKIEGRAREYAGWSLLDLGAELARHRGERVDSRNRHATADMLTRSGGGHSTSDFPLLLENALNKSVLPRYAAAAPSYKEWAAPMSFNDFRAHKLLRLGDFPTLKEVTAVSGEVQYGTISDNREQITAKEYASGISISRRALVNDDLGQLQDFTALIGQQVASFENVTAYTALAANAALSDSVALFHANHSNLAGSAAAISVTSIGLAMAAVRKQQSKDGIFLNLNPTILVVGPAIETVARQLTQQITPNTTASSNPWSNQFKLVVDANITDNAWYLFCDPNAAPVYKFGYVQGTGPVVRSEIDFDTRGLRVVVGLDFGFGPCDYRGAYRNAGA